MCASPPPHPPLLAAEQLGGYVATFDLRDPGAYTLQVVVAWYFGGTDPGQVPRPLLVGPFMAYRYNTCSHTRASIDGACARSLATCRHKPYQRIVVHCCPMMSTLPCHTPYVVRLSLHAPEMRVHTLHSIAGTYSCCAGMV